MQPYFPAGLQAVVPFDTTPFVKISIEKVVKTLLEAVLLVFLVMYLFLQNFRATLIPNHCRPRGTARYFCGVVRLWLFH